MVFNIPLFPDTASTVASHVDYLFYFILANCIFFSGVVFAALAYFAVRYRRERQPHAEQIHGSMLLEITWTTIPFLIAMVMFGWGALIFFYYSRPPANALEVYVVGKQWMWKIQHVEGQREINQLHVPVGRDVRLVMTSQDVIHDFGIPAFRIKGDVVPGRYTSIWFRATKTGTYKVFCDQYCGTLHSGMVGDVIVMEPAEYQTWLAQGGEGSMAQQGEHLFQQLGCNTCHRNDSEAHGPNLAGLYGHPVHLTDGHTVTADDAYIRESIVNPNAKIVYGFQAIMPSFQGQIDEEGVLQLISYIKSMQSQQPGGPVKTSPDSPAVPGAAQPGYRVQ